MPYEEWVVDAESGCGGRMLLPLCYVVARECGKFDVLAASQIVVNCKAPATVSNVVYKDFCDCILELFLLMLLLLLLFYCYC